MCKHPTDHDALPRELVGEVSRLSLREFHLQSVVTQPPDNLLILLIVEVGDDALRHHLTDTLYLLQLLESGVHQGVDILEVTRQQLGRGLAHKADAEGEHHALKGHFLRRSDTVHDPLCRLRARAVTIDLLHVDQIEVGHVLDQSLTVVVVDGLWAQRVDVHGLAGDEMLDATLDLWRTTRIVRTIPRCLALIAHQRRTALRTTLDKLHRLGDDGSLVDVHTHDLRDDLTAFLHIHIVADMQVETLDKILVVQRGALHGGTGQLHGIHVRHRGDGTRTPHLIGHFIQTRTGPLGLELIGDGPARTLGRKPKRSLLS